MTIDKRVKRLAKSIGIPAVGGIGVIILLSLYDNYIYHHSNVTCHKKDGKTVYERADGILGHTKLTLNDDGSVEILRDSWCGVDRQYSDENNDGEVDEIFEIRYKGLPGGSSPGSIYAKIFGANDIFHRDKHLKQHPNRFRQANLDFRKQMRRFKPYINNR